MYSKLYLERDLLENFLQLKQDFQSELNLTMPTVEQPIRAHSKNSCKTAGDWNMISNAVKQMSLSLLCGAKEIEDVCSQAMKTLLAYFSFLKTY